MSFISVPRLNWYGRGELKLSLPVRWQVEISNMAGYGKPALKPEDIRAALDEPIGTKPLSELARGKKEVVILFDDMSRITRSAEVSSEPVIRTIVEALSVWVAGIVMPAGALVTAEGSAGVEDKNIRFVCALGCHGPLTRNDFIKKLGEETLARFPVYNHNLFGNCVYVGKTTTYATEVYVNEEVMDCDLKIAIGMVVPHPMSGFGGGGKMILPGVCSFATIQQNHHKAYRDMALLKRKMGVGVFDKNPLRFDIEEAATLAGLDFVVNCLVNEWGEPVKLFAGALKPAYAEAVKEAKLHYLTPGIRNNDIVISNTFIKANEAFLGSNIAYPSVSCNGGDVVIIANAIEGMVVHYLLGPWGKASFGPEHQTPRVPPNVKCVIVYNEYPDLAGRGWFSNSEKFVFTDKWSEVLKILEADYPSSAKVAVFPNAEIQYVK
ncbi:MAG: lactate racemase domain-containing protein [Chloroflexi bacterium]|nr:lactate racemase domain-containing protein [Chloroflexota bacterium]